MSPDVDGEICQTNPQAMGWRSDAFSAGTHLLEFTVISLPLMLLRPLILKRFLHSTSMTMEMGLPKIKMTVMIMILRSVSVHQRKTALMTMNGTIDEGTNAYDDDGDGFSENDGTVMTTIAINPDAGKMRQWD